jgi:hypothetical protein
LDRAGAQDAGHLSRADDADAAHGDCSLPFVDLSLASLVPG